VSGVSRDGHLETAAGMLPLAGLQAASGSLATAMFRPEDVEIVPLDSSGPVLSGDIMSTFFMGDRTRLLVDIGSDLPIIVETGRRATWHAGERIGLRVPAQAILHLPPEEVCV